MAASQRRRSDSVAEIRNGIGAKEDVVLVREHEAQGRTLNGVHRLGAAEGSRELTAEAAGAIDQLAAGRARAANTASAAAIAPIMIRRFIFLNDKTMDRKESLATPGKLTES